MITLGSGPVLPVHLHPMMWWALAGFGHFRASGWAEAKEGMARVVFFVLFCFVLFQYKKEASGS